MNKYQTPHLLPQCHLATNKRKGQNFSWDFLHSRKTIPRLWEDLPPMKVIAMKYRRKHTLVCRLLHIHYLRNIRNIYYFYIFSVRMKFWMQFVVLWPTNQWHGENVSWDILHWKKTIPWLWEDLPPMKIIAMNKYQTRQISFI